MGQGTSQGKGVTSTRSLKLSGGDFRFLHSFIQGVDVKDAWARYMPHRGAGDLRRIRNTTHLLLDVLSSTAKRHGDLATAILLKRDVLRIKASMSGASGAIGAAAPASLVRRPLILPTLDEFAQTLEDPDFYSEAELSELWEQRFGKAASGQVSASGEQRYRDTPENRATKRRARLIERQLAALRRLELLVSAAPHPQDKLEAWFDSNTAQRLKTLEIERLSELLEFINRYGFKWHNKVPRIGKEGAARLVQWFDHHAPTLGRLEAFALAPLANFDVQRLAPAPQSAVVPLERFIVPSELSGFDGENRKPVSRCKIAAINDYQAVNLWLALYRPELAEQGGAISAQSTGNVHTYTAYRKEAERFLLWAVLERKKALSSLDSIDCASYRRFLENPPTHRIAKKGLQRWSAQWRPFEGPLGPRSRMYAETVCRMLCRWLVGRNYLDSDPWDGAPKGGRKTPLRELRALTDEQLELLNAWLSGLAQTRANARLQLLFELALTTGLRKEELANARLGSLVSSQDARGERSWALQFYGKGGKERQVPLLEKTVARLFSHLEFIGVLEEGAGQGGDLVDRWTDFQESRPELPLLARLEDPSKALPAPRIYELVKEALAACAKSIEEEKPRAAKQLKKASTHWLRHTLGRVWADRGGDLRVLGEILGHSNPATTAIYSRADEKRRRQEFNKVFG